MRTPLGHDLLNMKEWYSGLLGWLRLLALILLALCQSMVADQERSLKNISFLNIWTLSDLSIQRWRSY